MTPLYHDRIDAPSAWTPASLGGKEGLVHTLAARHLAAIDRLLASVRELDAEQITRRDFDDPELARILAGVWHEVVHGKGVAIIRGIDRARYAQRDCERIFWGLATHWGRAAVQSARGDRIGYVRDEPEDPVRRGYRSARELTLHTDARPVIALMSIESAASGGVSLLASSSTIHNIVREERPDLLAPLYRGYPYASTELGLTPYNVPVFSNVDGVVSCAFFESFMRNAAKQRGEPLPSDTDEAITFFARTAARKDVSIRFVLEPGEILISNNFVVLHARTEFQNSAEKQRLLLRLWLNARDIRPFVPELLARSDEFDRNYDPQALAAG